MSRLTVVFLLPLLVAPVSRAGAAEWAPEPRRILALYTPGELFSEDKDPLFHPIHKHLELPLNHLGLDVEYVDATKPLPDLAGRPDVRGILTWAGSPVSYGRPVALCRWLETAMDRGIKIALTGQFGFYLKEGTGISVPAECRRVFKKFGFEHRQRFPVDPLMVRIGEFDKTMLWFERTLAPAEIEAIPLVVLQKDARSLLRLILRDAPVYRSDPAALTPYGGFAFSPFYFYENPEVTPVQRRWVLNPFAFFEKTFALEGLPRPDATTLSGRRIFFSHIDGDGYFDNSEIDPAKMSSEVFLSEVIEKYPFSPITIGLIAGYYDLTLFGTEAAIGLSRKILLNLNVEAASHGYAHPLEWRKGRVALKIPLYKMDAGREVLSSGQLIENRILGNRSKVRLFQWSGDFFPDAKTVETAERAGLLNINGGGGRFDSRFPSYAGLYPIGRRVGSARQIYAPAFSENDFTEHWTGRYYGYREVLETFENTGAPRRVKPVNIYAHFHSAQRYASLKALQEAYEWAVSKPLIPVFTSRWVETARAFFEMKISSRGKDRFLLEGGAALRTVRFDGQRRDPDMVRSKGVLGFKRELGSLYVSLDESARREIVFSRESGRAVFLEEANFEISRWRATPGKVRFAISGFGGLEFTIHGLLPGRVYRITGPFINVRRKTDAEGVLTVRVAPHRKGRIQGEVVVETAG